MTDRDRIVIQNLRLRAVIGVEEWERRDKQDIVINLTIFTDHVDDAARSDDIGDALNYRALTKSIIQHVEESQHHLVETLAVAIAHICVVDFKASRAIVRVEKPGALRFADSVGIEIEREAGDFED